MQICTLEFPSVSFGRANALEHCKQCKHSNDVAAHFQMLPTLKREEKKTPSILRIRGKPLHKVFFSSWKKSLERFETSPPDYLIVSTINHRFPETFRTSNFCNFVVVFLQLCIYILTTASLRHSDLKNFAMLTGVYGR